MEGGTEEEHKEKLLWNVKREVGAAAAAADDDNDDNDDATGWPL